MPARTTALRMVAMRQGRCSIPTGAGAVGNPQQPFSSNSAYVTRQQDRRVTSFQATKIVWFDMTPLVGLISDGVLVFC